MDIAFTDPLVAGATDSTWSAIYDHAYLNHTVQQAYTYTARVGHEVLLSITLPVALCDPLRMFNAFARLEIGERFYWERPAEKRALVGVGAAKIIETSGPAYVAEAASAWRELQAQSFVRIAPGDVPLHTSGPVLVGGFTFDVLNAHSDLWQGFPDSLLVLPSLLFHCEEERAALTFNYILPHPCTPAEAEQTTLVIENTLYQLQEILSTTSMQEPVPAENLTMQDLLPADEWREMIASAVRKIRAGDFEKVVLARAVRVNSAEPFDIPATLLRLRLGYPGAYIFAVQHGGRYFVGATPERLVCGVDGRVETMALAGSARRGNDEEEDERLAQEELLNNPKNQGEHHVVVTTIRNSLASLCSRVWVADAPHVLKLKNIQHLQTPIMGDLLPGHSILEAIEDLHPTPAVGGYPRLPALETIRAIEHLDRGWYASPIGWIGTSGNGEFAVALRSALLEGSQATLFAGCGIVADSDPESEYQESCLKLQVILRSLSRHAQATQVDEQEEG